MAERLRPQTAQLQRNFCCSFIFLRTVSFSTWTSFCRSFIERPSQNSLMRSRSSAELVDQILALLAEAFATGCCPCVEDETERLPEFDEGGTPLAGLAGVLPVELKVMGCLPAARELGGGGFELRATEATLVDGGGWLATGLGGGGTSTSISCASSWPCPGAAPDAPFFFFFFFLFLLAERAPSG